MINRARWAVLALAAGLTVAACSSGAAATQPPNLEGTKWRVVEIAGAAHVRANPPTVSFGQGPHPWRQRLQHVLRQPDDGPGDDRRGSINSTLRLCEGDVGAIETQFMRALVGATSFAFDGGNTWSRRHRRRGAAHRLALRTRVESPSSARPSDGRAPTSGKPVERREESRAHQRRVAR